MYLALEAAGDEAKFVSPFSLLRYYPAVTAMATASRIGEILFNRALSSPGSIPNPNPLLTFN